MKKQMSDTLLVGVMLALSGGFMDAYSYIQRGEVFANAQTGNILLFGVRLSEGNFDVALQYFIPILAFFLGIMLVDMTRLQHIQKLHWRQLTILIEAIILLGVCFVPLHFNLIANSLTSLACGMQVESFRKIHGLSTATTMCIGNLRSGTENLSLYIHSKERQYLHRSLLYFGIIGCFVLGAILGNYVISYMHQYAMIVCVVILIIVFIMMFKEEVY